MTSTESPASSSSQLARHSPLQQERPPSQQLPPVLMLGQQRVSSGQQNCCEAPLAERQPTGEEVGQVELAANTALTEEAAASFDWRRAAKERLDTKSSISSEEVPNTVACWRPALM